MTRRQSAARDLRLVTGIGVSSRWMRLTFRRTRGGHYAAKTFDGHAVRIRYQPTTAEERAFSGISIRRVWEPMIDGFAGDLQLSFREAKAYVQDWLIELRAARIRRSTSVLFGKTA